MTDKKIIITNKEIIETYIAEKYSRVMTSEKLGYNRQWLNGLINRRPDLKEMILDAEEAKLDIAERNLYLLIEEGDFRAIKFFLETKGRSRGYGQNVEIVDDKEIFDSMKVIDGEKVIELE